MLRVIALVATGLLAAAALRRASAHTRHTLWVIVAIGVGVVPMWDLVWPNVYVKVGALEQLARLGDHGVTMVAAIWLGGVLVAAARGVPALFDLRRLTATARPADDASMQAVLADAASAVGVSRPVTLVLSSSLPVPATWGVLRPIVALPESATTWSAERLRLVLIHELLHVRRRDVPLEYGLWLLSALYWYHPAVWLAVRELRLERERACDEAVIATGARASDYCGHLVEIMRAARPGTRGPILGAAMAAPSTLERRVRGLLGPAGVSGPVRRRAPLLILVALVALALNVLAPCPNWPRPAAAPRASSQAR